MSQFHNYGKVMKRESGVNPEQTRCCKLRQKFSRKTQIHCLALERWEGRWEDGVSQKTCQNWISETFRDWSLECAVLSIIRVPCCTIGGICSVCLRNTLCLPFFEREQTALFLIYAFPEVGFWKNRYAVERWSPKRARECLPKGWSRSGVNKSYL